MRRKDFCKARSQGLKAGYNLIRIKEGDKWKTAFHSWYGHSEYMVIPFGLANAPATFQNMLNDIFKDLIDLGVVIYRSDILIYSESEQEHITLVKRVLPRLQEHRLAISLDKCKRHRSRVNFLGFIISADGVEMDQEKIKAALEWETLDSVKDIQSFLEFANFYWHFIEGYSKLTRPLADLMKKSEKFHSHKMNKHEINYEIHDKGLLAITSTFKKWRHYLEGARHKIIVYTDRHRLEWFAQNKPLNYR